MKLNKKVLACALAFSPAFICFLLAAAVGFGIEAVVVALIVLLGIVFVASELDRISKIAKGKDRIEPHV